MARIKEYSIILIFCVLHAAVSFASREIGFHDEMALTLLTMLMSVMLSLRRQMSVPFMVVAVILINFAGLQLGKIIGPVIRHYFFPSSPYQPLFRSAVSTFLITGILGMVQVGCEALARRSRFYHETDTQNPVWFFFAFVTVLIIRMIMMLRNSNSFFSENLAMNIIIDYSLSFIAVLWMAYKTVSTQRVILEEKKKKHEAQYSYERLKQQIEPHFLFNSLNSLDSIVMAGQDEQASQFIHKLSGIYRYLIETEDEHMVYLEDELKFVRQYIDLMKVRFPEGLETEIDINTEGPPHFIIPCSLQLLVENATKHNTISKEQPLRIRIFIEDEYIVVTNNRNPKITSQPSTGNGQRYIRKRYRDEADKEIVIMEEEDTYTVKLPLL